MRRVFLVVLACGVMVSGSLIQMAVATESASSSGMLLETEPNDTVLQANGPIPAAGFMATRATPDDHDQFILRLQPQRQVTMTLQRVSGCRESHNSNPTTFRLTRSDGKGQIGFSNWSGDPILTRSWTTPAIPVEYIGDIYGDYWWEGNQCTVTVVVSPADAVIEGELPELPPRDAAMMPADIVAHTTFSTTITGHAYAGDTLLAWMAGAGSQCRSVPSGVVRIPVPSGAFAVPVNLKAGDAGYGTACLVLRNPDSDLIKPSLHPATVTVRERWPLTRLTKSVRIADTRRGSAEFRCELPAGDMCDAVLQLTSRTLRAATIRAEIPAGQTKRITFRLTKKSFKRMSKVGKLEVTMAGIVTNGALIEMPVKPAGMVLRPQE